jgi:hypothetical protein
VVHLRKAAFLATGIVTAMLVATAPTLAQSSFCASLKAVVAQTGDGFASLRGAQVSVQQGSNGLTYTDYTYTAALALVGANPSSCQIVTTIDSGTSNGTYRCFFDYGNQKRDAELDSLARTIVQCIGPVASEDDIDIDTDNDVGSVSFVHTNYTVEIIASDTQPLVLTVSKPT